MKIKVPTTIEEDVALVRIQASVNYGEEEIPKNFPGRVGDMWNAEIDIDTGKILNWPSDQIADLHLTVKDAGSYYLVSRDGRVVAAITDYYVPNKLIPGNFGDTIEMYIGHEGQITGWPIKPDVSDFFPKQED
jgi:hypothetical protein